MVIALIIFIVLEAGFVAFAAYTVMSISNERFDEVHKTIAELRKSNKASNQSAKRSISKLEKILQNKYELAEIYEDVDMENVRVKNMLKKFPMFKDNKLGAKENDTENIYIICEEGSVLRYRNNTLTVSKASYYLKTLHAATTSEKRHMQFFDTLELLCNEKNFRSVYPVSDEDNNTLDVIMRDMSVCRYTFNRSYKSDGMIIEFVSQTHEGIVK